MRAELIFHEPSRPNLSRLEDLRLVANLSGVGSCPNLGWSSALPREAAITRARSSKAARSTISHRFTPSSAALARGVQAGQRPAVVRPSRAFKESSLRWSWDNRTRDESQKSCPPLTQPTCTRSFDSSLSPKFSKSCKKYYCRT